MHISKYTHCICTFLLRQLFNVGYVFRNFVLIIVGSQLKVNLRLFALTDVSWRSFALILVKMCFLVLPVVSVHLSLLEFAWVRFKFLRPFHYLWRFTGHALTGLRKSLEDQSFQGQFFTVHWSLKYKRALFLKSSHFGFDALDGSFTVVKALRHIN